jgi:4-amino-4-deoxy-L-arabinose transferase-like glycosyltransferase
LTRFGAAGYRSATLPAAVLSRAPAAGRRSPARPLIPAWIARHLDLLLLGGVLLAAALLRAAFLLRAPVFIIPDSENYFWPGFQLARGLGFDLEARRAPGYPLFIAGVIWGIGQDLAALALAQHALGLATVGLTYGLARATCGRLAAVLAGLLVALNGSLLLAEQTVATETLFTSLLALAALAGVLGLRRGSGRLLVLAGALLGVAALVRPTGLGLLPGLPLALAATRPGWRRWLRWSALYLVGFGLVLLPWMARNYLTLRVFSTEGAFGQTLVGRTVRHDRFIFVDPNAPPVDDGRQRARELMQRAADRGSFITPLRREIMRVYGLDELGANRLMRDLAVEAILRRPDYYALGSAQFLAQLATGWPERPRELWESRREAEQREEWEAIPPIAGLLGPPSELEERQYPAAAGLVSLFQPGRFGLPLLGLALLGTLAALLGPPAWRPALLPACWALGLLLIGVAFVGPVLRYRYPAEPFLAVLAGGGAAALAELVRGRVRCPRQE